jgi:hypothetical protein
LEPLPAVSRSPLELLRDSAVPAGYLDGCGRLPRPRSGLENNELNYNIKSEEEEKISERSFGSHLQVTMKKYRTLHYKAAFLSFSSAKLYGTHRLIV